jgi:hypothetical protein
VKYGDGLDRGRRRAIAGVVAAAMSLGLGAGLRPASAVGTGHFEAILCHCRTQGEANTLKAAAESLGYTAVIQVIHPNDIEVELINGLQTKADADQYCAREQPKLSKSNLHCHAEQEMHGIPSSWSRAKGNGPRNGSSTGNGNGTGKSTGTGNGQPSGSGSTGNPAPGSGKTPPTGQDQPKPPSGSPSKHVHRHGGRHRSNGGDSGFGDLSWIWFY